MHLLDSVLLLLATAVVVVVVFRALKLPALIGYLIVGLIIGPHALGWLPDTEQTRTLAEFGVVFLMFSIGLEFSLPKLSTMKHIVFGLGAAQVGATIAAVMTVAWMLGLDWRAGLALGGVLAMSSTAILAKMLAERLELNTQHGRQIIGVLLFQDLAVVPLLVLIPALSGDAEDLTRQLLLAGLNATLLLILILILGQRLMRPWFHIVARRKSAELFVLNVLLCTLGLAWLTERFGLSMALGAFLAGMLISETEYRYQVEQDIKPFQDVLLGLFFVTVGMQLDLREIARHWVAVPAVALLFMLSKAAIVVALARLFGAHTGNALRVGLALCAGGEFGLVLISTASGEALMDRSTLQVVLAAVILSMLLAPFILEKSEHLVRRFSAAEWMNRAMALHSIAAQSMAAERHVIICGFGRSGQNLARLLELEKVPFIALDADSQRVRDAAAGGEHVVFGDAARREVLIAAGLTRAAALVVSYDDTESALRILSVTHLARPDMPVIVRTRTESDIDRLKQAGAAEVVPEIMEGSLMLASHALMLIGVPFNRVLRRIRATREQQYGLFRGFFPGASDESEKDSDQAQMRLHSVTIVPGAAAVGRTLQQLNLAAQGVEVTAIRRRDTRQVNPEPETTLAQGDVVVLRGEEESLEAAEMRLLQR